MTLSVLHAELGIEPQSIRSRRLVRHREPRRLQPVGLGTDGRDKFLLPDAARAWLAMRDAAAAAGLELLLISAFRSVAFQTALIRAKLRRGDAIDAILQINAPPGYSEHHSGRAIDIGARDVAALDDAFENTAAFAWLSAHARDFGFALSYPRGNAEGYCYEPWHWCWHRPAR
ncbi:M15 family metallopeptidase [Solimonas terrae]|uniref:M15 family metallopeptidase n=1 Tax=Solimonas terrae TaxID=1396819 RepID=A0A6M2BWL3_9GAMM|nr:D-alanyl-D-alanine carboxypeptidase family protein [Solimonas terrae]NGY06685.1 M15 family metallopeptidase [Solimonas terrae]